MTVRAETIKLKRVYAAKADADGARLLVDRIWPRGLSKERAALTAWLKDVAPSTELRHGSIMSPLAGRSSAGATLQSLSIKRKR
jgi:uncharacterized protein YeaO (DUF488 family)